MKGRCDLEMAKKGSRKTKTLIERIFFDILKREMTKEERRVLLAKPKKSSKLN